MSSPVPAAAAEVEATLPGGAGPGLTALLDSFSEVNQTGHRVPKITASTDDYAAATLGQLKALAKPFYDRLAEAGLGQLYPWPAQGPADDYAAANLGQAKALFAFDLHDTDGDGLPNAWELAWGLNPHDPTDASARLAWLGLTAAEMFAAGMLPGPEGPPAPGRWRQRFVLWQTRAYDENGQWIGYHLTWTAPAHGPAVVSIECEVLEDDWISLGTAEAGAGYLFVPTLAVPFGPGWAAYLAGAASGLGPALNEDFNHRLVAGGQAVSNESVPQLRLMMKTARVWRTQPGLPEFEGPWFEDAPPARKHYLRADWTWSSASSAGENWTSWADSSAWWRVALLEDEVRTESHVLTQGGESGGATWSEEEWGGELAPLPGGGGNGLGDLERSGARSTSAGFTTTQFSNQLIFPTRVAIFQDTPVYRQVWWDWDNPLVQTSHPQGQLLDPRGPHIVPSLGFAAQSPTEAHQSFTDSGPGGSFFWAQSIILSEEYPASAFHRDTKALLPAWLGERGDQQVSADSANSSVHTWQAHAAFPRRQELMQPELETFTSPIAWRWWRGDLRQLDLQRTTWWLECNDCLPGPAVLLAECEQVYTGDSLQPAGPPTLVRIASLTPGSRPDHATQTPVHLSDPTAYGTDHVVRTFALLPVEIKVDGNRDGEMSFTDAAIQGKDGTTAEKPYRFWLNNDHDNAEQDQSGGSPDSQNNTIDQKRDLEDFTRLWISFKGITEMVKSQGFQLQLEWKPMDGSTTWAADAGNPAIKVFKAVESDGGKRYVEEDTWAGQQLGNPYNVAYGQVGKGAPLTLNLSQATLISLTETNPNLYFLFEGVTAGKGRLVLNLIKDGQKIGEYPPLYLDIRDIKNMYERWTVDSVANVPSSGADPLATAVISTRALPSGQTAGFTYDAQSPEEKKYIVFAHGWNMAPVEKDLFAETAYKRLWWQGYKGRFAAFQWPTTHSFDPTENWFQLITNRESYDKGEFIAWRSAPALAGLLSQLNSQCSGQVYLKGHSMGNVVAGEAMRLLGRSGGKINTYVACEAAVEAECYDPATATSFPLNYGYLGGNFGPDTPNIYPNWLTPSSAGVGSKVNFYNLNDYALNVGVWEFDQISKPDNTGSGTRWGWHYLFGSGDDQFWRYPMGAWTYTRIYLGDQADPKDRYEIMSYAAEPRSRALGRVSGNVAGFASTADMPGQGMWTSDPHNNQFKDREWHSGQFQFTNMIVRNFWDELLRAYKLKAAQ